MKDFFITKQKAVKVIHVCNIFKAVLMYYHDCVFIFISALLYINIFQCSIFSLWAYLLSSFVSVYALVTV